MKNQKGFVHIKLLVISILVLSAVGFSGYRVFKSNQVTREAKQDTVQSVEEVTSDAQTESEASLIELPVADPDSQESVIFTKGGSGISGDELQITAATSSELLNGTCAYTFTLGNSKVVKTSVTTNDKACSISIPLSVFPKNGDWILALTYVSKDGKTTGSVTPYTVTIPAEHAEKPRTISFTKGGQSVANEVVSISAGLSEKQSGVCTYKFSLNGTVRVEKTTAISNTTSCSIEIPQSDFPKSAIYSYTVSFVSSNGLVTAATNPWDIEII